MTTFGTSQFRSRRRAKRCCRSFRPSLELLERRLLLNVSPIPQLSSYPDAPAHLYLDFDGHDTSGTAEWNGKYNIPVIETPPYDIDGNPNDFLAEIANIENIWKRVAEDYAPFNINVTTVRPASFADGVGLRVAIGGTDFRPGENQGGVAYVGSFSDPEYVNTVFVFSDSRGSGNAQSVAEAASHEAGHAFGMLHQTLWVDPNRPTDEAEDEDGNLLDPGSPNQEYHPGEGTWGDTTRWAPIMGGASDQLWTRWNEGEHSMYYTPAGECFYFLDQLICERNDTYLEDQDDIFMIARSLPTPPGGLIGYRPDDHRGIDNPTPFHGEGRTLVGLFQDGDGDGEPDRSGIIGVRGDKDAFSFTTWEGEIRVSVKVLELEKDSRDSSGLLNGANLDPWIYVITSDGAQIPVDEYTREGTGWSLRANVETGQYRVVVKNNGDYGSLGEYTVTIERPFYTDIGADLPGVSHGASAWGDYDNDGDLDILLTGDTGAGYIAHVYRYNGYPSEPFQLAATLPGVFDGSAAWGDYDNDGDLDILLTGDTGSGGIASVYENDQGAFTVAADLMGVTSSNATWGDYDNDGDLDILLTGNSTSGRISYLYRNDAGSFSVAQTLTGVTGGAVAWGDYDADSDLDILLTGDAGWPISRVYRNDNATFVWEWSLGGVAEGSAAWGDYDADGDLDALLTGTGWGGKMIACVYEYEDENNTFATGEDFGPVEHEAPFDPIGAEKAAWADVDNNGYLDVLLAGIPYSSPTSVYDDILSSSQDSDLRAGLPAVSNASIAWGDYDHDGSLDILLTGMSQSGPITRVYSNWDWSRETNQAPPVPTALKAQITSATSAALSWNAIPGREISYEIRVGTTPGGQDVVSPMSLADGTRLIPSSGRVPGRELRVHWTLDGLSPDQTYYWSVQSIDAGFEASAFAAEGSFTISFVPLQSGLPHITAGDAAWGDYDSDGDLDLLVTGEHDGIRITRIYNNDWGVFRDIGAGLPGLSNSTAAWGDYDNDGDLDLVIAGHNDNVSPDPQYQTSIYRNDNGLFVRDGGSSGMEKGSVDWGDFDNDGDLDLLLAGGNQATIARNNHGRFTSSSTIEWPGLRYASVDWGDYDGDGDLDALLSGQVNSGDKVTQIQRNDGGLFYEVPTDLPGVNGTTIWGDYDADGDLDILLKGYTGSDDLTRIYRNDAGVFHDIAAGLPSLGAGTAEWADYDNDGDLDILLAGFNRDAGGSPWDLTRLYRNDNGSFVDANLGLTALTAAIAAFGDYDADGDVDLFLSGETAYVDPHVELYQNEGVSPNTPPTTPGGPNATVDAKLPVVTLQWNESTDAETPVEGLTYNLRVGTAPGAGDVVSPMVTSTGRRLIPDAGNVGHNTTWTLKALPRGVTYYWSVQAVDSGYAASGFATEGSFAIDTSPFTEVEVGLPSIESAAKAWGDYDNDGDLDLLLTGTDSTGTRIAEIYRNDAGFFTAIGANLPAVRMEAATWGDYDNDGDLDILLAGDTGSDRLTSIFRNDDGLFVDIDAGLPGLRFAVVAWGDYDNDGDLDLVSSGDPEYGNYTVFYHNNEGIFRSDPYAYSGPFLLPSLGSLAWGDYDSDGDQDLLAAGGEDWESATIVFRNDGGTLQEVELGLTPVMDGAAAWGDYDNDGDLDIVVAGRKGSYEVITQVYRNDGESFELIAALEGVLDGSVAWGDYDNDGDPDILLTGWSDAGGGITRIYENDSGNFIDINAGFQGVRSGTAEWGDYDGDGDLDVLVTGSYYSEETRSHIRVTKLYRNETTIFNSVPSPPSGLMMHYSSSATTFSWDPASDVETPVSGLTYNLRIGTTPGGSDVLGSMSDPSTGARLIVGPGNAAQNLSWTLAGSPSWGQPYYWSVQTIDAAFVGSAFSNEESFLVNRAPVDITLDSSAIDENEPIGTVVGTFATTDEDILAGDSHSYTLVDGEGGDDNASFTIEGATLKTFGALDYETQDTYHVRLRTTDARGYTFDRTFTISVNDINESLTDILLSRATVAESAPGAAIGTFTSEDLDSGQTHTYTILSDPSGVFDLYGTEGEVLRLRYGASADFETQSTHWVTIQSTDSGTPPLSRTEDFRIDVIDVREQTVELVNDVNPYGSGSWPASLVERDGQIYLCADDGTTGQELFRYDPATGELTLLADIWEGRNINGRLNDSYPNRLTWFDGKLYFSANDGVHGQELWCYDPTTGAANPIADLYEGRSGSYPSNLTVFNNQLYFSANGLESGETRRGLWKYHPSTGVEFVVDVTYTPQQMVIFDDSLYFDGGDETTGTELWKYHPDSGAIPVADVLEGPLPSNPRHFVEFNGELYFDAHDGTDYRLWKLNPDTQGISFVADTGVLRSMLVFDGELYFAADRDDLGYELWRYHPATGVNLVADIRLGPDGSIPLCLSYAGNTHHFIPNYLTEFSGNLYFWANDGSTGYELWQHDPSTRATSPVADLNTGAGDAAPLVPSMVLSYLSHFLVLDDELYFAADNGISGAELWKYDQDTGITLASEFNPYTPDGFAGFPAELDGQLYFAADDGTAGQELVRYDPATGESTLVADIRDEINMAWGPIGSAPEELTAFNGELYFSADDGSNGRELWRYDPATGIADMVADLFDGPTGSSPSSLTVFGNQLYFSAASSESGEVRRRLWRYDPSSAVEVVADMNVSSATMIVFDGSLFFVADDGTTGWELWKFHPDTGVSPVADIVEGSAGSSPGDFAVFQGELYFEARDGTSQKIMKYDPATQSINSVADAGSIYRYAVAFDDQLYFAADRDDLGSELWRYDPSTGVSLVEDITPGRSGSGPVFLTVFGNNLYFSASAGGKGQELWKYDPHIGATSMVADISPSVAGSRPRFLTVFDGELYFGANDGIKGEELWKIVNKPLAQGDEATTNEDNAVTIALLANDADPNEEPLTIHSYTQPSHGSVTDNGDGTVTYTPSADYFGPDSFEYTITNGQGFFDTAPVTITVESVNDAPVLTASLVMLTAIDGSNPGSSGDRVSDVLAALGDGAIADADAGAVFGVAVTAADDDYGTWQFSVDEGTHWADLGAVSQMSVRLLNADARVRFVPDADFIGSAQIEFCIWDRTSGSNGAIADASVSGSTSAFSSNIAGAELLVNIINLTKDMADGTFPQIDAGQVVWQAADGLYLYDGSATQRLDDSAALFQIEAGKVVWTNENGLFLYDGTSTRQLDDDAYMIQMDAGQVAWLTDDGFYFDDGATTRRLADWPHAFQVDDGQVVWWANEAHIYLYDGVSTRELSNSGILYTAIGLNYEPLTIDAGQVVWVEYGSPAGMEIYLYDGAATINLGAGMFPAIDAGQVVWQRDTSDGSEIYLYDGRSTRSLGAGMMPEIDAGQVVWMGMEGGLWLFDGVETRQLSNVASMRQLDAGQVVWHDQDGIYVYDGSTRRLTEAGILPTPLLPACESSAIDAGQVVWTGPDGDKQAVYLYAPPNRPPAANDDIYVADKSTELLISAPGVLANDVDVDRLLAEWVAGPSHGSLALESDGSFTYLPEDGFVGPDSFTYRASDGAELSQEATVSIVVAEDLGSLDLTILSGLEPSAGELWYTFEATRDGVCSAEMNVSSWTDENGEVLTLFAADGGHLVELARGNYTDGPDADGTLRFDYFDYFSAVAGRRYLLHVENVTTPTSSQITLANVVEVSLFGGAVTIHGTDSDDVFEAIAGSPHVMVVNGLAYDSTLLPSLDTVEFRGHGGSDTAVLRFSADNVAPNINVDGGAGDDTVILDFSGGEITGNVEISGGEDFDRLVATGGSFLRADTIYNGDVLFLESLAENSSIQYADIELLDLSDILITDLWMFLPDVQTEVVLEDHGDGDDGVSRVVSLDGAFEETVFANPSRIKIFSHAGNLVSLKTMDRSFLPEEIELSGSAADTFRLFEVGAIPDTATLQLSDTTRFELNNIAETIGALEGAGTVDLSGATLTVGANHLDTAFHGAFEGTGSLTKIGTGVWTVIGAASHTGQTNIDEGTLQFEGSYTGSGAVFINDGGTLSSGGYCGVPVTVNDGGLLSGFAYFGASVVVKQGGIVSGGSFGDTLVVNDGGRLEIDDPSLGLGEIEVEHLQLDPGATLAVAMGPDGTLLTGLEIEGSIDFNGATLEVSLTASPTWQGYGLVIDNPAPGPVVGTFAGLPEGAVFMVDGIPLQITYTAGDGNNVALIPPLIVDIPSYLEEEDIAVVVFDGILYVAKPSQWDRSAPLGSICGVIVHGTTESETMIVNIDGMSAAALPAGIWLTAGEDIADNDILQIEGPLTPVTEYGYHTTGSESGIIDMDGLTVHFFEFEPIIDSLSALNRTFTIGTPGAQTIRLADSTANVGMSTIESGGDVPAFESLTFANPAGAFEIRAGDGDDTIVVEPLDVAWNAALIVHGDQGNDTIDASAADHPVELFGGPDADILIGSAGDDVLVGGSGNDTLTGGPGADRIEGGQGSNQVVTDLGDEVTVNEGDTFKFAAVYPDPQSAEIDWDDGAIEPGQIDPPTGTVSGTHVYSQPGEYTLSLTVIDGAGQSAGDTLTITVVPVARVDRRYVFYNNSAFDGGDPAADPTDDHAIAPDKQPLLPGETATPANYTSFSRGITGIMVDIAGLTGTPTVDDFEFRVGNISDPQGWQSTAPPTEVHVRPDAGVGGSDRVSLVWKEGAVTSGWLEVTMLATANTGLAESDVFCFANMVGDANGDGAADLSDFNLWNAAKFTQVGLEALADFDRSGAVDLSDFNLWNAHKFTSLATAANPVPSDVVGQELSDPTDAIDELARLRELDQSRSKRSSDASTLAAEAVDRLLATYWE